MKLSIIILTWNSSKHIERCLESLFTHISPSMAPYEVIVVDNGSVDNSGEVIEGYRQRYPEQIRYIRLEQNRGTTFSRNLALKQATGNYISIIDSDVIITNGIYEVLTDALKTSETMGMVVPRLVYGNGAFQKSTDHFPTILTKLKRYFFLKRMEKEAGMQEPCAGSVDYAISAFWLMKREVTEAVGLLDEKIFYAPEDVDYCLRIWKQGYRIHYQPEVRAIHNAQEISRGFRINRGMIEHVKGLIYFFFKHGYCLRRPRFF